MNPYDLLVDVWEGNINIDEPVLLAGGVGGMIVRLNDMRGGHHMDENFVSQWAQAAPFIRTLYFVYNPWATGWENFTWLRAHCPDERLGKRIMIDVEVRKEGYSPIEYARQLEEFIRLCKAVWIPVIYTGAWFLPLVSEWPTDVDYWWARYPYTWYPTPSETRTWERINADAQAQSWTPGSAIPGPCRLWQISGDRIKPPGCDNRAIDLSLWRGTRAELANYFGDAAVPVPTPPPLPSPVSRMALSDFINLWTGLSVDFDKIYPNQCMDLVHHWIYQSGIYDKTVCSRPTASQVWIDWDAGWNTYFTRVPYIVGNRPEPGNIIIWNGTPGHIAICVDATGVDFRSFDANWPVGSLPHIQYHNYSQVLGWLHPRSEGVHDA